jgi:hypothetical protein
MAPYLKINSYLRFSDEFGSVPRGCVKSIPPPSAAKGNFERTLFSLILRSKINENSVRSKHYLAA